jgi:hypothetical protein
VQLLTSLSLEVAGDCEIPHGTIRRYMLLQPGIRIAQWRTHSDGLRGRTRQRPDA